MSLVQSFTRPTYSRRQSAGIAPRCSSATSTDEARSMRRGVAVSEASAQKAGTWRVAAMVRVARVKSQEPMTRRSDVLTQQRQSIEGFAERAGGLGKTRPLTIGLDPLFEPGSSAPPHCQGDKTSKPRAIRTSNTIPYIRLLSTVSIHQCIAWKVLHCGMMSKVNQHSPTISISSLLIHISSRHPSQA